MRASTAATTGWHARGRAAAVGYQDIGQGPARGRGRRAHGVACPGAVCRRLPAAARPSGLSQASATPLPRAAASMPSRSASLTDAAKSTSMYSGAPARPWRLACLAGGASGSGRPPSARCCSCAEVVDDAADAADVRVSGGLVGRSTRERMAAARSAQSLAACADLLAGHLREVGGRRTRAKLGRCGGPCRDCLPVGRHGPACSSAAAASAAESRRSGDVPCSLCGGGGGCGRLVAWPAAVRCACCRASSTLVRAAAASAAQRGARSSAVAGSQGSGGAWPSRSCVLDSAHSAQLGYPVPA